MIKMQKGIERPKKLSEILSEQHEEELHGITDSTAIDDILSKVFDEPVEDIVPTKWLFQDAQVPPQQTLSFGEFIWLTAMVAVNMDKPDGQPDIRQADDYLYLHDFPVTAIYYWRSLLFNISQEKKRHYQLNRLLDLNFAVFEKYLEKSGYYGIDALKESDAELYGKFAYDDTCKLRTIVEACRDKIKYLWIPAQETASDYMMRSVFVTCVLGIVFYRTMLYLYLCSRSHYSAANFALDKEKFIPLNRCGFIFIAPDDAYTTTEPPNEFEGCDESCDTCRARCSCPNSTFEELM